MILSALASLVAVSGEYACTLGEVAAIGLENGEAHASMIEGLPQESLTFGMSIKADEASVDWPNSPIQASGRQTVLPTAPGAGMVMLVSKGPCLFTESACANMLNFAAQPDNSLSLLITPTAVSYDKDHDKRFPFLVMMRGSCHSVEVRK